MKQKRNKFPKIPQWFTVIGQSGAGKDEALFIFEKLCEKYGVKFFRVSTGAEFRKYAQTDTYFSGVSRKILEKGDFPPYPVAMTLCFNAMNYGVASDHIIIHDGMPRYPEQFPEMLSLVKAGYMKSLKVLEVYAPEKICYNRLFERAKVDQRTDTSTNGKPNPRKIKTKMNFWTVRRNKIISMIKKEKMYLRITNTGTLEELERKIEQMFFSKK